MQDPIADMLTRIRNGQMVKRVGVEMPASTLKTGIAKVLQEEGYIAGFEVREKGKKSILTVELIYYRNAAVIQQIERVSRPGLRIYKRRKELPKILGGLGI